jgi:hypothetical protein
MSTLLGIIAVEIRHWDDGFLSTNVDGPFSALDSLLDSLGSPITNTHLCDSDPSAVTCMIECW